jgi:SPW repeat
MWEVVMARVRFLLSHNAWEDWLGVILGLLIVPSPWLAGQTDGRAIVLNAAIVGVFVLMFAELELVALQRRQELAELALGLWLMASPIVFGYADAGQLRILHYILGGLVALLAALELWQGKKLDRQQQAEYEGR